MQRLPKTKYNKSLDDFIKNNNKYAINELMKHLSNDFQISNFAEETIENYLNGSCLVGNGEMVERLLQSFKNKLKNDTFYYAVKGNNTQILRRLIKFADDSNQDLFQTKIGDYLNENKDNTTLIQSIKNQDFEQVHLIVEKCGASVNLRDKCYPIHYAASKPMEQITEYLIKKCVDINSITTLRHETPLILACRNKQLGNAQILIKNGANVNIRDCNGCAAINYICPSHTNSNEQDFSFEFFKSLLESNQLDMTIRNDHGKTAFSRVCENKSLATVELFYSQLLKLLNKSQPHSICKDNSDKGCFKVMIGSDYILYEITKGIIGAISYLKVNNCEFLLRQLENKIVLSKKIQTILENEIIITLLQRHKLEDLNAIFKLLIQYEIFPYGTGKLYSCVTTREDTYLKFLIGERRFYYIYFIYHLDTYDTYATTLQKCIDEQIKLMIEFGIINKLEQIQSLKEITENTRFENCRFPNYNELVTSIKPLKVLSRNCIRRSLRSMSDINIDVLQIPNKIKNFIAYG